MAETVRPTAFSRILGLLKDFVGALIEDRLRRYRNHGDAP
jgi:hypothetical protein